MDLSTVPEGATRMTTLAILELRPQLETDRLTLTSPTTRHNTPTVRLTSLQDSLTTCPDCEYVQCCIFGPKRKLQACNSDE